MKYKPAKKASVVNPKKGPKPMNPKSAGSQHPMVSAVQANNNSNTTPQDSENLAAMQMAANASP